MRYEELTKNKKLQGANKARKEAGIQKLVEKERNCLRCDKLFTSTQIDNRMCDRCRQYD